MNFFEQQLRKFTIQQSPLKNYPFIFAGRAAFLPISGNRRARVEFITTGVADEYTALRITMLNAESGEIDRLVLHFRDYCSGKRTPHIWRNSDFEWYGPEPTSSEINAMAKAIHDYIQVIS